MRAFSRGCTKTSPMPRSASSAATRSASPAQPAAGGVIAADTTNRPEDRWSASEPDAVSLPASAAARPVRAAAARGCSPGPTATATAAACARSASTAALMCVGVVPQQPPTRVTPASANRVRYREK